MRFLLVDKILHLDPGKSIVAAKTMDPAEEIFRDHFPGFPVVPGVLMTEMIAQAAGKCLDAERFRQGKAMLGKITSATFRRWLPPGEEAVIHAVIENNRKEYAEAKGHIEVNGVSVCSASLFFVFLPTSNLAKDYRDEVLEAWFDEHGDGGAGCVKSED